MRNESFGEALRRLRLEHQPRISLRALGSAVNYSHVYLWQIESGQRPVTGDLAVRCDAALDAGGELVAIAEEQFTGRLRTELRQAADRTRVEASQVRALRRARDWYEQIYRQIGGVAVRPRLLEYTRQQAAPLLKATCTDDTASSLYQAVGGLVALAGICAYDANQQPAARQHYRRALDLAKASGDRAFIGYVVSLLATQALRCGDPQEAIRYADSGLAAWEGLTPALRADLHCLRAEAYAQMADPAASNQNMREAYNAGRRIDLDDEPPEARHIQPGVLEGRHAEVLRILGELDKADEFARESIRIGRQTHPRGLANRLVIHANVLLSGRQIEEAAATAIRLVDLAESMESRLLRERVRRLRTNLVHFRRSHVVQEFCDRADALAARPL